MKTAQRPCPCCAADRVAVLHRQEFCGIEDHPLADGYDVVACDVCGFVYADSSVTQQAYDSYYERMSKYADAATGTGGALQPWDAERLRDTAAVVAEHVKPLDGLRLLDVGCANGGLLACLKDLGFGALTGVDPARGCVETTRSRGIEAMPGHLGKLAAMRRDFDCVILSHVLEHVADLRAAIADVAALLAPDGCMYIEVPDATRYADYLYAPFQDFNTEHINHFSPATLRNLMATLGMKPVVEGQKTIRSSATSLYPALWGIFVSDSVTPQPVRDNLVEAIGRYITASGQMMRDIQSRLAHELDRTTEVVIWGTGQLAMKVLSPDVLGKTSIAACVDANPVNHGRLFHGAQTVGPEEIRFTDSPIVIASLLHQTDIQARIRAMGLPNRVITLRECPEMPFGGN